MITPRIDKMEGVKTPLNAPNLLAIAKFLGICVTTKDRKKIWSAQSALVVG